MNSSHISENSIIEEIKEEFKKEELILPNLGPDADETTFK